MGNKFKKTTHKEVSQRILILLKEQQGLTSRELVAHLNEDKNSVLNSLQLLLEQNKIAITSQNKFKLLIDE